MNVKTYGTVRCKDCDQNLEGKIQCYDYGDKEKKYRVVRCEQCNSRVKDSYYE